MNPTTWTGWACYPIPNARLHRLMPSILSDMFYRLIEYLEPAVLPLLAEVAMFVGLYLAF
jgi:hypothetical protein